MSTILLNNPVVQLKSESNARVENVKTPHLTLEQPSEKKPVVGWWRGVSYIVPAPKQLKLIVEKPSQNIYWRGAKTELKRFEADSSIDNTAIESGWWRGVCCKFKVARKATVLS